MISKLQLPTLQTLSGSPKVDGGWGFSEKLGDLQPRRYNFSGSGELKDGVFKISRGEIAKIYYPLLPGHLYKLSGTVEGSIALMAGATSVGKWSTGPSEGTFVPSVPSMITLEGPGTVADLTITLLQSVDFALAHQN